MPFIFQFMLPQSHRTTWFKLLVGRKGTVWHCRRLTMNLGKIIIASVAIAMLSLAMAAQAQSAGASKKSLSSKEIGDLLETYRAWGLPLPPQQAQLVRFSYGGTQDNRGKVTPIYHLAFLLKAATNAEPPCLLVGTLEYRPKPGETEICPVDIKKVDVKSLRPDWMKPVFEINVGLATALQCQAQGYDRLAAKLFAASLGKSSGLHFFTSPQASQLTPQAALAFMAWAHWRNELILPNTDRKLIARQMQALLTAEPQLNTQINRTLLENLNAALIPSQAKTGSTEALIDDLVEVNYSQSVYDDTSDPRYQRIAALGFKAVPDLIEHLDDHRLTRTARCRFSNFSPFHLRVCDLVSDLLQGIAGSNLGRDWLRRRQGYPLEKAAAQSWWEKTQKTGEEDYLVAQVLTGEKDSHFPNQQMLNIIVKEYPLRLPALYRKLLTEKPTLQSWPLVEAIAQSSLPQSEKISLLLYGSTNQSLSHRRAALAELREFDETRFVSLLIDNLNTIRSPPTAPYWECDEAGLANLVMETDDPLAWQALLTAAQRADVGLRMELMDPMNYSCIGQRQQKQRLDFLAAFLHDAAVRNENSNPALFDGPYAGFIFPKMQVRNFAAMQIANILRLPDEPTPEWTPRQWSALRKKVEASLKQ